MSSGVDRIKAKKGITNAVKGQVVWSPVKSIWVTGIYLIAFIAGFLSFTWSAFSVFSVFTVITLLFGHSLGMHRCFIHNSFSCPIWLEIFCVHLGVLVGLAGPFGMMHTHDLRDWAQRQGDCHDYFAHRQPMLKDAWWQMHCDVVLEHPPEFVPESSVANNRLYHWMEHTWMLQQLPWALLLFWFGGFAWVIWGIFVRLAVSITGHWLIGYFAHNKGQRFWHVKGAGVQGYNIRFASLLTMGESWHNNHHAFPGSALLGIYKNQPDPGWWMLMILQKIGLVWNIVLPKNLPERAELQHVIPNWKAHFATNFCK